MHVTAQLIVSVPVPLVEPGDPTRTYQVLPAVTAQDALLVDEAQLAALSEQALTGVVDIGQDVPL